MKSVIIHTDGGCEGNPGPGGWAAVLRCGEQLREVSGGEPATTNNRMELQAAIGALAALKEPCAVTLHTDSSYLRNGITQWLKGWKRNGWRTSTREPVKNDDLWKQLDAATAPHRIEWRWLKGHAGHADNERCDQLAAAEMVKLRQTHTRAQLAALRDQFVTAREPKRAVIERGSGLLKRQPGDLPFAEEWAEHKQEEKDLEEAKQARHGSP